MEGHDISLINTDDLVHIPYNELYINILGEKHYLNKFTDNWNKTNTYISSFYIKFKQFVEDNDVQYILCKEVSPNSIISKLTTSYIAKNIIIRIKISDAKLILPPDEYIECRKYVSIYLLQHTDISKSNIDSYNIFIKKQFVINLLYLITDQKKIYDIINKIFKEDDIKYEIRAYKLHLLLK